MNVIFAGAEKGSHLSLLLASGVTSFAVNLTQFPIPKRKELVLSDKFKGGDILVYVSETDLDIHRFDDFIRQHESDLHTIIGMPDYDGEWLGSKYVPMWNDKDDLERLANLCERGRRVALSDKAITSKTLPRIKQLQQRWGTEMIVFTSKVDLIDSGPWHTVVVGSWTSVIRYGETQVWDGHGLRRYPAQQKEAARKRHRSDIIRLGVNYDDVMEDSVDALGMLAIRSWQAWAGEDTLAYDPSGQDNDGLLDDETDTEKDEIVTIGQKDHSGDTGVSTSTSITIVGPKKRHESEKVLLPGVGLEETTVFDSNNASEQEEPNEAVVEKVTTLASTGQLLRQCDSCYLASRCPAFKEESECGFNLPVEIRTKDQLMAAMRIMVEMQATRVLFSRFAEELDGQGLDPALSVEIDRMFTLIEKMRNITESREHLSISMDSRGGAGVLSRLFGSSAGGQAKQLPNGGYDQQDTDKLYGDIMDIEGSDD